MDLNPQCTRCRLREGRKNVVPPTGNLLSPVCLIGEAPGKKEDIEATPFVGRAGSMLDKIMEEGGVTRGEVMITNAVKCRPPGNRNPRIDELEACFPHLEEELEGKDVLIAMGRVACKSLLGRDIRLKDEANKVLDFQIGGSRRDLIPTYHPAACLFNLKAREGLRETMRIIRREYL